MYSAAATATRTYVCNGDRHRAVETMRFSASLRPSLTPFPPASCSRSPKPISSPRIYLPFSLSLPPSLSLSPDDNRILSERALARAISRPICSFLQEEPPPSHTTRGFRPGDPLLSSRVSCLSLSLSCCLRARTFVRTPPGRRASVRGGRQRERRRRRRRRRPRR